MNDYGPPPPKLWPPRRHHFTPEQEADRDFMALAKMAVRLNKQYLIDWLWKIYDGTRGEEQRKKWERANKKKASE